VLSEVLSYNVIAVESDELRTIHAKERAVRHSRKKLEINSRLHHETLRIDGSPESIESLRNILKNHDGADRVCLVGLHCCGDLTPMFLKTFAALDCAVAFICVGCCYHLMRLSESRAEIQSCPLSSAAIKAKASVWPKSDLLLTVSSLRLATQETKVKWLEELDTHVQGHFFRAVLECVADESAFLFFFLSWDRQVLFVSIWLLQ
jgi:Methyltransferase domain